MSPVSERQQRLVLSFLRGQRRSSDFAASLVEYYTQHGYLSDRQWAAAERMRIEAVEGRGRKASEPVKVEGLDLSNLPAGHYGVPGNDSRLKVQIDRPTEGDWTDWIFVKDGAVYGQGRKYGHQKPGQTYRGEIEAELRVILADPYEAMAEYGRLTETCGLCGRPLEHEDSVARGIGPVCARKMRAAL
jgi:hypothetical protein